MMNETSNILNVLIACEESQAETKAFRDLGHNAFSCDIQKCRRSGNPDWHILGDVTPYLNGKCSFETQSGKVCSVEHWDLIIAHPPCTYITRMGARWMYGNADFTIKFNGKEIRINRARYLHMLEARSFFLKCLNAKAPFVAVENPIPLNLAKLPKANAFACPSWFGVKYTKKTLYWLKNLPPLMAELIYPNATIFATSTSGKYRSRTFPQLAQAIAKQWSEYILREKNRT